MKYTQEQVREALMRLSMCARKECDICKYKDRPKVELPSDDCKKRSTKNMDIFDDVCLRDDHQTEKGGETLDNIQKYCNDCDIKGYCDKIPTNCPIAKEYKRIAEFEKAKSELKSELSKPFIKFLDWLENKLQRIEKWWHNG